MVGVPVIVGASLTFVTVMLKAGNAVMSVRSATRMIILLVVPTLLLLGIPVSVPVLLLKDAHGGLLLIVNVNVSLSISLAVGVKL